MSPHLFTPDPHVPSARGSTAQTADGVTPAVEAACDPLTGRQYGLCVAYCEAMDCESAAPHASATACAQVLANFQKASGGSNPPCVAPPPPAGPCAVLEQQVAGTTLVVGEFHCDGCGGTGCQAGTVNAATGLYEGDVKSYCCTQTECKTVEELSAIYDNGVLIGYDGSFCSQR